MDDDETEVTVYAGIPSAQTFYLLTYLLKKDSPWPGPDSEISVFKNMVGQGVGRS